MTRSKDIMAKSKEAIGEINDKAYELRECVEKMRIEHALADKRALEITEEATKLRIEIAQHLKVLETIITQLLEGKE